MQKNIVEDPNILASAEKIYNNILTIGIKNLSLEGLVYIAKAWADITCDAKSYEGIAVKDGSKVILINGPYLPHKD